MRVHSRCHFATAWGFVALGLVACASGVPSGRPDSAGGRTLGEGDTSGASDVSGGATANGDGSSSAAFPPPDMSGPLPEEEGSTGGESSTSASETSGALPDCDIYEQDCPAGEKCTAWASQGGELPDAVRCVSVSEPAGQPGDWCVVLEPLSGEDDCAVGSFCQRGLGDENYGVCVSYCAGGPKLGLCENPDQACGLFFGGVAPICVSTCKEGISTCPVGQTCEELASGVTACLPEE